MTGLVNGTGYTFAVIARDLAGASAPCSAPSAPVHATPADQPRPAGQPRTDDEGAGQGQEGHGEDPPAKRQVVVRWKHAARATSYRVRISKPSGKKDTKWNKTTERERVFKTRLRSGEKYRVEVRAVGPGAADRSPPNASQPADSEVGPAEREILPELVRSDPQRPH